MWLLFAGELATLAREIVKLIKQGRLPKAVVQTMIIDARMGKFEADQRKRTGEPKGD